MDFEFLEKGDQLASLKIVITPSDYQPKVESKLKEYRRKISMPGFRQGKVPADLVKKMYGESTLADESLHLASEGVFQYLKDNKIKYILSPMIDESFSQNIDWKDGNDFAFSFDIALEPEIDPVADETYTFIKYNIVSDESDVDKYLDEIRERYGKFDKAESINEKCFVSAQAIELDENSEKKEGGLEKFIHIRMNTLSPKIQELFENKKNEEVVLINIEKDLPNLDERTELFNISFDEAKEMSGNYKITINTILLITPAELNEQLFNQVFPGANIENEEQLRDFIRKDIKGSYEKESKKQFYFDVQKALKSKYDFKLPEEFLKKFLRTRSEKEITDEDIEKGYSFYEESLKWQIIENKLISKYDIRTTSDDIKKHLKELLGFADKDDDDPEVKERVNQVYDIILEEKNRFNNLVENMTDERIIALFEEKSKIELKEVNWKEFINLVNEKNRS